MLRRSKPKPSPDQSARSNLDGRSRAVVAWHHVALASALIVAAHCRVISVPISPRWCCMTWEGQLHAIVWRTSVINPRLHLEVHSPDLTWRTCHLLLTCIPVPANRHPGNLLPHVLSFGKRQLSLMSLNLPTRRGRIPPAAVA